MYFLVPNIFANDLYLRFADRERPIASLPAKLRSTVNLCPSRRVGFEIAKKVGETYSGRQFDEKVHVVGDAVYFEGNASESANYSAEILVQIRTNFRVDHRKAAFGAEYNVIKEVCIRHMVEDALVFLSPANGLREPFRTHYTLTRVA